MRLGKLESDPERQQLWDAGVEAAIYEEYQDKTSRKIPVFIAEPH